MCLAKYHSPIITKYCTLSCSYHVYSQIRVATGGPTKRLSRVILHSVQITLQMKIITITIISHFTACIQRQLQNKLKNKTFQQSCSLKAVVALHLVKFKCWTIQGWINKWIYQEFDSMYAIADPLTKSKISWSGLIIIIYRCTPNYHKFNCLFLSDYGDDSNPEPLEIWQIQACPKTFLWSRLHWWVQFTVRKPQCNVDVWSLSQ